MSGVAEPQCWRCEARADIGCEHYPPRGPTPPSIQEQAARKEKPKPIAGPWGAKGNASGPAGDRMREGLKAWAGMMQ